MDNVYLTLRMQRWQGRIASATNRIWPCISPFMFREVMEAALSATPKARVRHRFTRRLIEHLNPKLAALPLAQGYPALPLRIGNAHRFFPLILEALDGVRRRLPKSIGSASHSSTTGAPSQPPVIWKSSQFRELMQPLAMKTSSLYDHHKLAVFLITSRQPGFSTEPLLGRIFTLEMLARSVAFAPDRQKAGNCSAGAGTSR